MVKNIIVYVVEMIVRVVQVKSLKLMKKEVILIFLMWVDSYNQIQAFMMRKVKLLKQVE